MADGARYRRVYANDWHHPAFRRLNDSARIVRFYVTSGPQTTSVGCFRLSTALAVEDLGGTAEGFEERLVVVCDAFSWAWDPVARVVWIRDWFESNPPASPNVVRSWAKLLQNVPGCDVKDEAVTSITASLENLPAAFREPFECLSRTSRKPKTQPKVQPETNQGSGIRDQRSGSKGTGAQRADGSDGKRALRIVGDVDERLVSIAGRAKSFTNPDDDEDRLVDAFHQVRNADGIAGEPPTRAIVLAAFAIDDERSQKRQARA